MVEGEERRTVVLDKDDWLKIRVKVFATLATIVFLFGAAIAEMRINDYGTAGDIVEIKGSLKEIVARMHAGELENGQRITELKGRVKALEGRVERLEK